MAAPNYSVPQPHDRVVIWCLYCNRQQEVSAKAMSITCRFCSKPLRLGEVRIDRYEARRAIETCGTVIVEKRGNVVSDRVHCGSMIVRGKVKGHITSRGAMLVGPEAEIKGDVTAKSIAVAPGAILEGRYQIGPAEGGKEVQNDEGSRQ